MPEIKSLIAWIASLVVARGLFHEMPIASKVALSPGPRPRTALPPDISAIEAMLDAVIAGFLV